MVARGFLFLIYLLLAPLTSAQSNDEFLIPLRQDLANQHFSNFRIGYLSDGSKELGITDIQKMQDQFESISGDEIFKGQPRHIWLHFILQKESDDAFRNYLLQIGNAHIADYEIFLYDDIGLITKRRQGDNFPYTSREVRHNLFIHNLPDIENDRINVFIRVDQEGQELNFPLNIFERDYFIQHTLGVKISHGLILGLFFITSIVTFVLFLIYKERFFLYEVIVSFASILYIISEEGYGLMMLWPQSPQIQSISRPLSVGLVIIFSLLFTIDFLDIHKRKRWLANVSYFSIVVFVAYLILAHPFDIFEIRTEGNVSNIISGFLILLLFNCILIVGIAYWSSFKDKNRDGFVVFLVFAVTVIAIVLRLLAIQGLGASSELIEHTGFITRGIHIPLIGGYLIYKTITNFRENQEARVSLLEEKSQFTKSLIENIDNERQRISMALHDSAGSIITGIKANLEMADQSEGNTPKEHLSKSIELADQLQVEIRNISNDLLPSSITKLGLHAEIKRILNIIEETYNIETKLESNSPSEDYIGKSKIFHLYYIIRESLDNAVKYSEAKNILVQYFVYDDEINVLIEDDGKGFNIAEVKRKGGNGLKNLELRVSWLGGSIDIYSEKGTSISINIPRGQTTSESQSAN